MVSHGVKKSALITFVIVLILYVVFKPVIDQQNVYHHKIKILASPDSQTPLVVAVASNTKYQPLPWYNWTSLNSQSYIQAKRVLDIRHAYDQHKFNQSRSDELPPLRTVPNTNSPECKAQSRQLRANGTITQLLDASVIITFHNEARSTLLRTVITVFAKSPSELLREIILIDDGSKDPEDGSKLAGISKVKVFRSDRRQGLVRARLIGAKLAKAPILIFLDSHVEPNIHWLEPLLLRLSEDQTRIATPIIDRINKDNFQYTASPETVKAGFTWSLMLQWLELDQEEEARYRENPTNPIQTPSMAGGLFAVHKRHFFKIGAYDAAMRQWGAENIDLALRQWMCGGVVEIIPCSRVGHVFRKEHPYDVSAVTFYRNTNRVAAAWLGSYAERYYKTVPFARQINFGSVAKRVEIKHRLKCRSFEWYLRNIFPELAGVR